MTWCGLLLISSRKWPVCIILSNFKGSWIFFRTWSTSSCLPLFGALPLLEHVPGRQSVVGFQTPTYHYLTGIQELHQVLGFIVHWVTAIVDRHNLHLPTLADTFCDSVPYLFHPTGPDFAWTFSYLGLGRWVSGPQLVQNLSHVSSGTSDTFTLSWYVPPVSSGEWLMWTSTVDPP